MNILNFFDKNGQEGLIPAFIASIVFVSDKLNSGQYLGCDDYLFIRESCSKIVGDRKFLILAYFSTGSMSIFANS